ncbi:MAG: DNA polymerase IV [Verrucomicrobiota bacterium]
MSLRKIIHIDMDCFYAAVEMREQPELKDKPIAVGGGSRRGVVCTCNYVAREYGVRSAMPGFKARERCPQIIFLPVRFDLYRTESAKIRSILSEYTTLLEPLSLDEAYLDVSHHDRYAWSIAKEIRKRIYETTRLTASAGIAPNKMLAKIASDWKKPNGQFAVTPDQIEDFMATLPVKKIWGVGPKSVEKFERLQINTCGDLQKKSRRELISLFGKWGEELYELCRGNDHRNVVPDRPRKSLSNERTYSDHLTTLNACQLALEELFKELEEDLAGKADNRIIKKAFVKVRFSDFSRTTKECICSTPNIETFFTLLKTAYSRKDLPVRLLGAGVRFEDSSKNETSSCDQQLLDL